MLSKVYSQSIIAEKKERLREEKMVEIDKNEDYIASLMMDAGLKVKHKETDNFDLKKDKIERTYDRTGIGQKLDEARLYMTKETEQDDTLPNVDYKGDQNGKKNKKNKEDEIVRKKFCLKFQKLQECDAPKGKCPHAHSIKQLSIDYKPHEWINLFAGSTQTIRELRTKTEKKVRNTQYFRKNPIIVITRMEKTQVRQKCVLEKLKKKDTNYKVLNEKDLFDLFSPFGEIEDFGMSEQQSWIAYREAEEGALAQKEMHGKYINDLRVKVERVRAPEVIQKEMSNKVFVDKVINNKGRTLLIEACSNNNQKLAVVLIIKGASPTFLDWGGLDSICYSLKNNNLEMLQYLFQSSTRKDCHPAGYDESGSRHGHLSFQHGIDTEQNIHRIGGTYLIYASKFCSQEIIKYLLALGCNPCAINQEKRNALFYSAERGMTNATQALLEATQEHKKASQNEILTQVDINGMNPLDVAYGIRSLEQIEVLIKGGAAFPPNSEKAKSLLFLCCEKSCYSLMRILSADGIGLQAIDKNGCNVIMIAYKAKQFTMCKSFFESYGLASMINQVDKMGDTFQMILIKANDAYMAHWICQNVGRHDYVDDKYTNIDIDFDVKNNEGKTALMIACEGGLYDTVKILLENKLDAEKCDNIGCTAQMYAAKADSALCISTLQEINCDILWKDKINRNSLDYAKSNLVKKLLLKHLEKMQYIEMSNRQNESKFFIVIFRWN